MKNETYGNTSRLIFKNSISLIIGQGMILALFFLSFIPLLNFLFHMTLKLTGFSYVTLDNLGSFLLNPLSIIMLILLLYIVSLFMLLEIYFLVTYFSSKIAQKKINVVHIILVAMYKVLTGVVKGNFKLIATAWIMMMTFNLPLIFFQIRKMRLLAYVEGEVTSSILWIAISVGAIGLIFLVLFRKSFVFHYHLIRKLTCSEAVEQSKTTKNNRPLKTFFCFLGWNVGISLVLLIIYTIIVAITMIIVSGAFDKKLAIVTFISINEKIKNYLAVFMMIVSTVSNFALVTQLFYQYGLAPKEYNVENVLVVKQKGSKTSLKKMLVATVVILLVIDFYFFIDIIRNGSALNFSFESIKVTSHRGFSHKVPENTILSIKKAMDEQVDFIEVDVRLTKDGELVLLHDTNLKRTTGVNKNIWELNYSDIAELDAGSWMSDAFAEARIPTLREVFEVCKGKVYLNLDLKYRNWEEGLEDKVISVINEFDMKWQCVVTSSNIDCLIRIKELDPDIQTGYITYQLYPGLIDNVWVDFFSMHSGLVTRNVVQDIHRSGKKIYVWTVNSKKELERLSRIGVDNIITDNPAYAKEILFLSDSDQYLVTLLKIIIE